jgi:hypothetical protein
MKTINVPQPELAVTTAEPMATAAPERLSTISILEAAVRGGITAENVAVVEKLITLRRDEEKFANKIAFNKAFFTLRREISTLEIYADKSAKTDGGGVAYRYCSEKEISECLDPVLFRHGFTMMFGQRQDGERTSAIITLVHEAGHEETREYAVRSGSTNRMKDATAADTGATTSAWRHLCIKWFGLKSRIREDADPRNEGMVITSEQSADLEHRAAMLNCKPVILEMAGAKSFAEILTGRYPVLVNAIEIKERKGR